MPNLSRFSIALKAIRQLGLTQVGLFGLYKVGLITGHYRRITSKFDSRNSTIELSTIVPLFFFPTHQQILATIGENGQRALLAEADEIVGGKFRMFGSDPVEIRLAFDQPLRHWTDYEANPKLLSNLYALIPDIKLIWEPARFGWAFSLGRAWHVTGDDRYAGAFWRYFEMFTAANPPFLGPNWTSGQEVAIRLMALAWANQVFANAPSSTDERKTAIAHAIAHHALRIPPTIIYARSQNNNHLLTEAAGLYTASLALPEHPQAEKWRQTGQKWLNWCFENQIDDTGEYVQHSTNYQRLMLQTALYIWALEEKTAKTPKPQSQGEKTSRPSRLGVETFTRRSLENLSNAARWLAELTDPVSGQAANLGANDGAHIFPLTTCPFSDFRPTVQAAGRAFVQSDILPPGEWDEMSLWFGLDRREPASTPNPYLTSVKPRLPILRQGQAWGYLRAARINSRPSHADSLHFDLWWRGLNIARDAGTYLYNADPPWDNRLASTLAHNTVSVDGREQMTRTGRFLYLDWQPANADWGGLSDLNRGEFEIHASHRAYGLWHRRSVTATENKWQINDRFQPLQSIVDTTPLHNYRLHWLLPDWPWEITENPKEQNSLGFDLRLQSPFGWIIVRIEYDFFSAMTYEEDFRAGLVRCGERLWGNVEPAPIEGWFSPTYARKTPTLAFSVTCKSTTPQAFGFTTDFIFPLPTNH